MRQSQQYRQYRTISRELVLLSLSQIDDSPNVGKKYSGDEKELKELTDEEKKERKKEREKEWRERQEKKREELLKKQLEKLLSLYQVRRSDREEQLNILISTAVATLGDEIQDNIETSATKISQGIDRLGNKENEAIELELAETYSLVTKAKQIAGKLEKIKSDPEILELAGQIREKFSLGLEIEAISKGKKQYYLELVAKLILIYEEKKDEENRDILRKLKKQARKYDAIELEQILLKVEETNLELAKKAIAFEEEEGKKELRKYLTRFQEGDKEQKYRELIEKSILVYKNKNEAELLRKLTEQAKNYDPIEAEKILRKVNKNNLEIAKKIIKKEEETKKQELRERLRKLTEQENISEIKELDFVLLNSKEIVEYIINLSKRVKKAKAKIVKSPEYSQKAINNLNFVRRLEDIQLLLASKEAREYDLRNILVNLLDSDREWELQNEAELKNVLAKAVRKLINEIKQEDLKTEAQEYTLNILKTIVDSDNKIRLQNEDRFKNLVAKAIIKFRNEIKEDLKTVGKEISEISDLVVNSRDRNSAEKASKLTEESREELDKENRELAEKIKIKLIEEARSKAKSEEKEEEENKNHIELNKKIMSVYEEKIKENEEIIRELKASKSGDAIESASRLLKANQKNIEVVKELKARESYDAIELASRLLKADRKNIELAEKLISLCKEKEDKNLKEVLEKLTEREIYEAIEIAAILQSEDTRTLLKASKEAIKLAKESILEAELKAEEKAKKKLVRVRKSTEKLREKEPDTETIELAQKIKERLIEEEQEKASSEEANKNHLELIQKIISLSKYRDSIKKLEEREKYDAIELAKILLKADRKNIELARKLISLYQEEKDKELKEVVRKLEEREIYEAIELAAILQSKNTRILLKANKKIIELARKLIILDRAANDKELQEYLRKLQEKENIYESIGLSSTLEKTKTIVEEFQELSQKIEAEKARVEECIKYFKHGIERLGYALELEDLQRVSRKEEVKAYALKLLGNILDRDREIREEIEKDLQEYKLKQAKGYTVDRLTRVDRQILKIAVAEIIYIDEIPEAVAINEAVKLARLYSGAEISSEKDKKEEYSGGYKFINGILRRTSDRLKAEAKS